jgi:peptidoglycan hydrolase-like protein with peptidoglycan-binding domain
MALQQIITGSVGFKGLNARADVEKIQTLLKRKGLYQGKVDSICGSKTIDAIRKFQGQFMRTPDGRIDPCGITWEKLSAPFSMKAPLPEPQQSNATHSLADFSFPFAFIPSQSWHEHPRKFGATRSNSRRHAGCDLYAPSVGTPIYAVSDGILVRSPYPFYDGTDALEVRHGNLLVRYGEIKSGSFTGAIVQGKKIAEVGKLLSINQPMLHIEIYTNATSTASLTNRSNSPYQRRGDLTDPTPYLDAWANNLPQP